MWPNPQETADLATFTEEIINRKLHFLCSNSYLLLSITVCNFQSIKSPMELYSFLSKLFCYITWLVISPDYTRRWTTCKRGLSVKSYCFFETKAKRIKNYKLINRFQANVPFLFYLFVLKWRIELKSVKNNKSMTTFSLHNVSLLDLLHDRLYVIGTEKITKGLFKFVSCSLLSGTVIS